MCNGTQRVLQEPDAYVRWKRRGNGGHWWHATPRLDPLAITDVPLRVDESVMNLKEIKIQIDARLDVLANTAIMMRSPAGPRLNLAWYCRLFWRETPRFLAKGVRGTLMHIPE
jgi:hypothetical protein